jgi:hypothetical protein
MTRKNKKAWGKLYELLHRALPDHSNTHGQLNVCAVATTLGLSTEGVYKWLRVDRITPDGAKAVVRVAEGRVSESDFLPFLFG